MLIAVASAVFALLIIGALFRGTLIWIVLLVALSFVHGCIKVDTSDDAVITNFKSRNPSSLVKVENVHALLDSPRARETYLMTAQITNETGVRIRGLRILCSGMPVGLVKDARPRIYETFPYVGEIAGQGSHTLTFRLPYDRPLRPEDVYLDSCKAEGEFVYSDLFKKG